MGLSKKPDPIQGTDKEIVRGNEPAPGGPSTSGDLDSYLFRALAETLPSAVFIIQSDYIIYINPAGQRILGYSQPELANLPYLDLVHPEYRESLRLMLQSSLRGESVPSHYEFKVVARQGKERWADFTGAIIHYQGEPALLGTALDVTEIKEAHAEHAKSELRYAKMIGFLPDPTFAVDREGRVIIWNQAMEKLSGIKAADMLGKDDYEYALVFWGERRPILIDLVMDWDEDIESLYPFVRREGDTLITEAFAPNLPGGGKHLWGRAAVLHDSGGNIIGAIETVRDITVRIQLEERLRQSAEKHQTLVQSLPSGVITVNSRFQITEINPQGQRILGRSQEDVLGKFCGDVLRSGACQSTCPIKLAIKSKKPAGPIETTVIHQEKGRIPISLRAAGLYNSSGELTGGVEVFHDISAIKALERERANLVSMFAHDMKSPLVGIQGFALRMLKQEEASDQEKNQQYLEVIRREAARLESIINDFLDFARLETGGLKLNFSATDLDKELLELAESLAPRFDQAGISLELVYQEKLPVIQADALHLRRAFANLLENAIKYSQSGTKVTIDSEVTDKEVLIMVADQGEGIPAEELPYIFDMFYRAKGQESSQGHGLGLAGVEAIVKGHGGRVMVSSEEGKGSIFTMVLPKDQPESDG
jgi:PAS domain S-box-containing protein